MHGTVTAESVEQSTDGDPASGSSLRWSWIIWGLGALCYFIALFHRASLGVAAPDALERFSAGPAVLAVFSALQLAVYLVLQVPSGLLADRLGPRKVITGGMVALAIGSLVFGLSTSVAGGITGRVLIGIGDAFMFTNVLRLAAHWFPPGKFGKIAALTGLAGGFGQVLATLPLSGALRGLGWLPTFSGAAVLTAAVAGLAGLVLRDRPAGQVEPSAPSAPERIGHTLRAVLAQRGTRHAFWVHFVLMAQFVAITTLWGSPWLTSAQGYDKSDASMLLLLCVLGFLVGSWFSGQYVAGRGRRRERFTVGLSAAVVAAWAVIIGWPAALPGPVLLVALLVIGFGGGAAMLAFDCARAANHGHRSGTASGVVNMGGFTAAVLIQIVVGVILQVVGSLPAGQAYRWAFLPVVVLLVAGTWAQWRTREPAGSHG